MLNRRTIDLRPAVTDLDGLGDPSYRLSDEVLAAIRGNSPLHAWIAALPKFSEPKKAAGTAIRHRVLPEFNPAEVKVGEAAKSKDALLDLIEGTRQES